MGLRQSAAAVLPYFEGNSAPAAATRTSTSSHLHRGTMRMNQTIKAPRKRGRSGQDCYHFHGALLLQRITEGMSDCK